MDGSTATDGPVGALTDRRRRMCCGAARVRAHPYRPYVFPLRLHATLGLQLAPYSRGVGTRERSGRGAKFSIGQVVVHASAALAPNLSIVTTM